MGFGMSSDKKERKKELMFYQCAFLRLKNNPTTARITTVITQNMTVKGFIVFLSRFVFFFITYQFH
jgi:hypothetical protein